MHGHIYHLIAYKILYLTMYVVFKRSLSICHTLTFLVGAHRFGAPFPKLQTFSEIYWALHIDYSQSEKLILGIFVYLLIYEVTMKKVNFLF